MRLLNSEIDNRIDITLDKSCKSDSSSGVMSFGEQNDYPQKIEKLVSGSQTAKAARGVFAKFCSGGGFTNPQIGSITVGTDHKGKPVTLDNILRAVGKSIALNNGAYIHANINAEGVVGDTKIVSFKDCRFSPVDDIGYTSSVGVYDNWDKSKSKRIEKNKIAWYYNFNLNKDVVESNIEASGGIENFKGQIYTLSIDDEFLYPLSPFDSVYLDCDTEYQVQLFKNRQVRDGFAKKIVLLLDASDDDAERADTIAKAKSWMGPDGENLLIFEAEFDEETNELAAGSSFKIETIDSNIDDKLFENWEKTLANSIRKAAKALPAVLIDYEQGGLSQASGEMLNQAVKYYNAITLDERNAISQMFEDIYSNFNNEILRNNKDWSLKPLTLFENIIPLENGTTT